MSYKNVNGRSGCACIHERKLMPRVNSYTCIVPVTPSKSIEKGDIASSEWTANVELSGTKQ